MSKIDMVCFKEKCQNGAKAVTNAVETAKDISLHPKFSASLKVGSKSNNDSYFNKGVKVDKEFTLWNAICMLLAVAGIFVAFSLLAGAVVEMFNGKKKHKNCSPEEE